MQFWQYIKNIFGGAASKQDKRILTENEEPEVLLFHQPISRKKEEKAYYQQWNLSNTKAQFLDWLHEQYHSYINTCNCHNKVCFLMIPSVNGFVIHFDENLWQAEDFVCLFDYLRNRLKSEGYWTHVSDIKALQQGERIETTQRHYLKPPRQFDLEYGEKIDQKFGNIMVILNFVGDKLCSLKFSATHYNDRLYHPARSFEELMRCICSGG